MNGDVINTQIDISKELEAINFKELVLKYPRLKYGNHNNNAKTKFKRWAWRRKCKVLPSDSKVLKKVNYPRNQLTIFRDAMKLLLIVGQTLGLNPVRGILASNITDMRFTVFSWKFLYCFLIGLVQLGATALCLYRLEYEPLAIGSLAFICFYAATCSTTFLFIQIGCRWPKLMKEISEANLDEYIDPRIKLKCNTATILMISAALTEHILSFLHKCIEIVNCHPELDFYDTFLKRQFPWFFEYYALQYKPLGIVLQLLDLISTLNWNYIDLFIICMSMYLASILKRVNEKIIAASENHHLSCFEWRKLREDYTIATRLVRCFDDVFSGIVFCSFAANLFFICLQIFNVLAYGVRYSQKTIVTFCPQITTGLLSGDEYVIYLAFSVSYLIARSLTVSLVAASVHSASLVPAPALYNVPASAFCEEVSRFIEQVNADTVALSGLQFFYVTRDLVLSVAGTIVTYELVLLQFSNIS